MTDRPCPSPFSPDAKIRMSTPNSQLSLTVKSFASLSSLTPVDCEEGKA